jgi:hypothetical protein
MGNDALGPFGGPWRLCRLLRRDDAIASVAGLDRCSAKDFSDVRRLREAKPPEIPWHGQAPVHEGLAQM